MILDEIVKTKKKEVEESKSKYPLRAVKEGLKDIAPAKDFRKALADRKCAVIAEIKRKSPSRGIIRNDFNPLEIAEVYEKNGAAAVSVLTDETFFGGKNEFLTKIKGKIDLPVLRKDFVIDPYQVYETKRLGADAVLLIARILKKDLKEYLRLAEGLGLFPLVEIHSPEDLDLALAAGADLIGINNRDLATFETGLRNSLKLASLIPKGKTVVAESGIQSRSDVEILMEGGIHAFLVGESLMRADDVGKKLRELTGQ
jgi:indole-3-glycerol phosphate synthase